MSRILAVADDREGTLIVTGSPARRGLTTLASVSERVGAHALGPVLVLRSGVG